MLRANYAHILVKAMLMIPDLCFLMLNEVMLLAIDTGWQGWYVHIVVLMPQLRCWSRMTFKMVATHRDTRGLSTRVGLVATRAGGEPLAAADTEPVRT